MQGVGFRPFVYGLARELGLSGFVLNDPRGVMIEIEGEESSISAFRTMLLQRPPPLAEIETVSEESLQPLGTDGFEIRASEHSGSPSAVISPDVAVCDECLAEMWNPDDRRYLYPYINCTNCGPRFTIARAVPYDRATTTMASFTMCDECRAEYTDPTHRRFHAQPIACWTCGPRLTATDRHGRSIEGEPIEAIVRLISGGAVVAVKGLGGFHLACDATNASAIAELRRRKQREEKPLAVMVDSIESARACGELGIQEEALLLSMARPIVVVHRAGASPLADEVAPRNRHVGLMLPYSPVHHLLLAGLRRPIVLTSGNISDEPIAYRDDDARSRLGEIADAFLIGNRDIHMRCDDSVMRIVEGVSYPIRRARGFAPRPISVSVSFDVPVLGAGTELKNTFCIGSGDRAVLSHHIGDLENYEVMSAYVEAIEHFQSIYRIRPSVIGHDLHPDYLATRWALGLEGVETVGVQHHHAHIASCLTDNERAESVIGLALDGTGYGEDGGIWGCEVLACDLIEADRLMHLREVALPGGAAAIKQPWRVAASYLHAIFGDSIPDVAGIQARNEDAWDTVVKMTATGTNAPAASSAGRLFDAVAALCGLRDRVAYEGQAAAELEQVAERGVTRSYPCAVGNGVLDGHELVAAVVEDLRAGRPVGEVAAAFHNGFAAALVAACTGARDDTGLEVVALSGGSFQNVLLTTTVAAGLVAEGFEPLVHHRVPPNDGGVSLGQAVVAAARIAARSEG